MHALVRVVAVLLSIFTHLAVVKMISQSADSDTEADCMVEAVLQITDGCSLQPSLH